MKGEVCLDAAELLLDHYLGERMLTESVAQMVVIVDGFACDGTEVGVPFFFSATGRRVCLRRDGGGGGLYSQFCGGVVIVSGGVLDKNFHSPVSIILRSGKGCTVTG